MGFPSELALATRNEGKIREILQICADWPVRWAMAREVEGGPEHRAATWPEVQETGQSYLENALLKARAAARGAGVPAVADDSGIEVDALGGEPGTRSARFAEPQATDAQNLARLCAEAGTGSRVIGVPMAPTVALMKLTSALGLSPLGDYHALMYGRTMYFDIHRTMAELPPEEKNAISHRGGALRSLGERLRADP